MDRGRWWPALAAVLLVLTGWRSARATIEYVPCKTAGGSYYSADVNYDTYSDTSQTDCKPGVAWCIRTNHSSIKLPHWHYTDNFTSTERVYHDRYIKEDTEDGSHITATLDYPTTSFNCHAYALYGRGDVLIMGEGQGTALADDFNQCYIPPACVGDVIKHAENHSSLVNSVTGQPAMPDTIKGKWGLGGKYVSDLDICGGPVARYRAKP